MAPPNPPPPTTPTREDSLPAHWPLEVHLYGPLHLIQRPHVVYVRTLEQAHDIFDSNPSFRAAEVWRGTTLIAWLGAPSLDWNDHDDARP